MAKGKKAAPADDALAPQVMQAIQETQKKIEVIQGHLDKLQFKVGQEQKQKKIILVALQYLDSPAAQTSGKYYTQMGKAFAMKPLTDIKAELSETIAEIEKDLPKLLMTQAQFEVKKKEQWHNLQQVAEQVQQNKSN